MKEIQRTVKEADVQLLLLDLNSLDSVRKFAANLHSTVDKVCNPLSGCTIGCDDFNILVAKKRDIQFTLIHMKVTNTKRDGWTSCI